MYDIDTVVIDVWKQKKNVDYLHYFKFEFFQLSFIGSLFMTTLRHGLEISGIIKDKSYTTLGRIIEREVREGGDLLDY